MFILNLEDDQTNLKLLGKSWMNSNTAGHPEISQVELKDIDIKTITKRGADKSPNASFCRGNKL